jgi:HEAT repeat protein
MPPYRRAGNVLTRWLGLALFSGLLYASTGYADRLPSDPVEDLRQALNTQPIDKTALQSRVAALRTPGDLRRALVTLELQMSKWAPEIRDTVATRLQNSVRIALKDGDSTSRLAAVVLVGELGIATAGTDGAPSLARMLIPELTAVVEQGDPRVSAAAARSLGKIVPDLKTGIPALERLLKSPRPELRLAAADALYDTLVVLRDAAKMTTRPPLPVGPAEFARAGQAVVPVAAQGFDDPDAAVRRRCMEAVYMASVVLTEEIVKRRSTDVPFTAEMLLTDRQIAAPVVNALVDQAPALSKALRGSDPELRRLAGLTLENMGVARERLQQPVAAPAVPAPLAPPREGGGNNDNGLEGPMIGGSDAGANELAVHLQVVAELQADDRLLPGLRTALPAMIEAVRDPDERVRLSVIDVLETMGPEAASAVPVLSGALKDKSRFVRWSAARALGRIGPVEGSRVGVDALIPLLTDPDLDVRLATAVAFERLGPVAKDAVPALAQSIMNTHVTQRAAMMRAASMRALVGIGTDSVSALPAIAEGLTDADARVRRIAAESLGRFGPAARGTVPALTRALDDPDADVRRAASDALLNITPGPGR